MAILFISCMHVISLVAAGHALLTKRDPRSALGWTCVLVFLPVAGLGIYLVFGISRAHSRAEFIMQKLAKIAKNYQAIPPSPVVDPPLPKKRAQTMAHLGFTVANETLTAGNEVLTLHNGDEAYPAMLAAIYNASDQVYLSTYIFNYGHVARAFITALRHAYSKGVDVRVLVDGIGALYSWHKPWRILEKLGVPTQRFRPPTLFPPNFGINLRTHRKLLVCDGRGFTGGMNISDDNVLDLDEFEKCARSLESRFGAVQASMPPVRKGKRRSLIQDIQFQCNGPISNQLVKAFLLNWSFCSGKISYPGKQHDSQQGEARCRVVVDGPGDDGDALNDLIAGVINLARESVHIMTPYFLPTSELMGALRSAGQRGVEVRVILPAKNNLPYMSWATKRILPELLKANVQIWYQRPPFAHTKVLCVDSFYTLIGSANLDSRSLRLNFELNTEIYDPGLAATLVDFMDQKTRAGIRLTEEWLISQSLPIKLRDAACWVFSPYL